MVADLAAAPMAADEFGEELGRAGMMATQVVGDAFLDFLRRCRGESIGDCGLWRGGRWFFCILGGARLFHNDEGAHVRQADLHRIDGKDLNGALVVSAVLGTYRVAGKRGEVPAAMFPACAKAVGWLFLSWKRKSPPFSTTNCILSGSQCRASAVIVAPWMLALW